MAVQQNIIRGYKITNGENLGTFSAIVNPAGVTSFDYLIQGGVTNQFGLISVNYAKLVSLFVVASQPVIINFNGTNAVQSVTISGGATGGTFTITYGGYTTPGIAWNASAATVQTALQALTSIGANNVLVTGNAGGPYTLTFVGTLGIQPITTVTASASGLTGGTPVITPASVTTGIAPTTGGTANWPWSLPSNWAIDWAQGDPLVANPLGTTSITSIAITNPGTVAATVNFRAGTMN